MSGYVPFTESEWAVFQSHLSTSQHQKGDIIQHIGDVCCTLSFIQSGVVRAYVLDADGKDYTWNIFFNDRNAELANRYVVDYGSFVTQTRSRLGFEVLDDCELFSISYQDLQSLYGYSRNAERFGRLMAELAYAHVHHRVLDQLTKTAQQRYDDLLNQHPYLLDKVPQYHIATFLGIAPQSLSRLKKRDTG